MCTITFCAKRYDGLCSIKTPEKNENLKPSRVMRIGEGLGNRHHHSLSLEPKVEGTNWLESFVLALCRITVDYPEKKSSYNQIYMRYCKSKYYIS